VAPVAPVAIVADEAAGSGVAGVAGVTMFCTPDAASLTNFPATPSPFFPISTALEKNDPTLLKIPVGSAGGYAITYL